MGPPPGWFGGDSIVFVRKSGFAPLSRKSCINAASAKTSVWLSGRYNVN
jgi:hypothetical protein